MARLIASIGVVDTTSTMLFDGGVVQVDAAAGASCVFSVTTADAVFNGSASSTPVASFNVTTADATFDGSASGSPATGTITTPALKNNTGTVLASETGVTAYVYTPSTGELVVKLTGETTDGSGVLALTDASIVAGTQYRVVIVLGSGAEGMDKLTAS